MIETCYFDHTGSLGPTAFQKRHKDGTGKDAAGKAYVPRTAAWRPSAMEAILLIVGKLTGILQQDLEPGYVRSGQIAKLRETTLSRMWYYS